MIHDIYPDVFDNQYRPYLIRDEDPVFVFNNNVCYFNDSNLPAWGQLKDKITTDGVTLGPVYAYSINDVRYFLIILKNAPTDLVSLGPDWHSYRHYPDRKIAFAIMNALHLVQWYNNSLYCGRCGSPVHHSNTERMLHCPVCDNSIYPRISPAILAVIKNGDRALFTKYKGRAIAHFVLVAGFVEFGETLEECVRREVREEVGLDVNNVRYIASQPWGYVQNLMLGFCCDLAGSDEITLDTNELKEAAWLTRDECPDRSDDDVSLTAHLIRMFKRGEL